MDEVLEQQISVAEEVEKILKTFCEQIFLDRVTPLTEEISSLWKSCHESLSKAANIETSIGKLQNTLNNLQLTINSIEHNSKNSFINVEQTIRALNAEVEKVAIDLKKLELETEKHLNQVRDCTKGLNKALKQTAQDAKDNLEHTEKAVIETIASTKDELQDLKQKSELDIKELISTVNNLSNANQAVAEHGKQASERMEELYNKMNGVQIADRRRTNWAIWIGAFSLVVSLLVLVLILWQN